MRGAIKRNPSGDIVQDPRPGFRGFGLELSIAHYYYDHGYAVYTFKDRMDPTWPWFAIASRTDEDGVRTEFPIAWAMGDVADGKRVMETRAWAEKYFREPWSKALVVVSRMKPDQTKEFVLDIWTLRDESVRPRWVLEPEHPTILAPEGGGI